MSEDPIQKEVDSMVRSVDVEKEIDEVLKRADQKDPRRRLIIYSYESGDVVKFGEYSLYYKDQKWKSALQTSLADAVIQLKILCKVFGQDWNEMLKLGALRLQEYRERKGYSKEGEK